MSETNTEEVKTEGIANTITPEEAALGPDNDSSEAIGPIEESAVEDEKVEEVAEEVEED